MPDIQFFETIMGHKFYDGSIPMIIEQLSRIADSLDIIAHHIEIKNNNVIIKDYKQKIPE